MTKVVIVGPEQSKWPKKQEKKARREIRQIILTECMPTVKIESPERMAMEAQRQKDMVTVISGHCPNGGVDIWAEEVSKELGVETEIHAPEVSQWEDMISCSYSSLPFTCEEDCDECPIPLEYQETYRKHGVIPRKKLKGYKSRNIDMAKSGDVVYCIVPKVPHPKNYDEHISFGVHNYLPNIEAEPVKKHFCFHCNEWGHPTNGGCWTMKYAEKLGKETHLVVVQ